MSLASKLVLVTDAPRSGTSGISKIQYQRCTADQQPMLLDPNDTGQSVTMVT